MPSDPSDARSSGGVLVGVRPVDIVVSLLLIVLGTVLAIDNWRIGVNWASDGPQSGYFPFRLSLILIAAATWGLISALLRRDGPDEPFVEKDAFGRVLKVLVPSVLYVGAIYWLGLYVSSALLIAVFMIWLGKLKFVNSIATASIFALAIFWLFEVKFKVLLPKGPLETWLGF
ncbi:MAG: tripartite tricarboxylate transporter TctB family protein [Hyphomicrobiaceae bacterium]|nr:tripartite tricarboxylate transporter TctB family protein [Hyphomicrobiaceae bacterium]